MTLSEVEALARGDYVGVSDKAKQEVLNCLAAMKWIWERRPNETIEESDLLRLHRLLTQKILPEDQVGRYKLRPNRVVNYKGITIYKPPPPNELLHHKGVC